MILKIDAAYLAAGRDTDHLSTYSSLINKSLNSFNTNIDFKLIYMKNILYTFYLLAGLLFSCNSSDSDPRTVLDNFLNALDKKDMATARKLATEDSKDMFDLIEMASKMKDSDKDKKEDIKYNKADMEFGEPNIKGDKATVPVKEKKSGITYNYILRKEQGKWKVAFSKSSMVEMGMDKMKEMGVPDSIYKKPE